MFECGAQNGSWVRFKYDNGMLVKIETRNNYKSLAVGLRKPFLRLSKNHSNIEKQQQALADKLRERIEEYDTFSEAVHSFKYD
jgi:hypothetical protein